MKERGKFSLWLKRMQPFQLGRGADVREWTERHLIIHHHHNHHDSLYDSNTDDAWVNTWYQLPESDFRRSWNFSCSTVIMMELWWWWWSWSWWSFCGYHNDATLVMAMTVTITMSITVKAIVKIVTFQNPIYWYGFCPLDPIKSFYLTLLKDYKNSEWSVATLWSLFHWFLLLFFQIKSQGWLGDWISLSVQMFQIILRLSGTLLDRVPTWLPEASGLVNLASN